MMMQEKTQLAKILETDSGIDPDYQHHAKSVTPGEPLARRGALLKWYGVHPTDLPVPDDVTKLAHAHLTRDSLDAHGLGFVLLHRCGNDFYFLIVCTWRNSNELWETVFYKDGDEMEAFAPFPREGEHKPAFCVWELVPVWHEQQAWAHFLLSEQDETAAKVWLADCFSGTA